MKKESFEGILGVFENLARFTASNLDEISFDDEVRVLADALTDIASSEFDKPMGRAQLRDFASACARIGYELSDDEPDTAIVVASRKNGNVFDCMQDLDFWPTWSDGSLVRLGEAAISPKGSVYISGVELEEYGWKLWGYLPEEDNKRCLIDEGFEDEHHPSRGSEEEAEMRRYR